MSELVHVDAYARASLDERVRYLKTIAGAGDLLPKAFMGRPTPNPNGGMFPAQVEVGKLMLVAELGSSLGLHPTSAVTSIHIIDGKPSLSANLLSALVRKAGHKLRVTTRGSIGGGDFVAVAELIRSDDPDFTFHVEWTMERAQRAGLLSKDNWKKYPEAMLKSRAITEVVREGAPDVTLFAAYAPEELGATVGEDGEPIDLEQVRPQQAPPPPRQEAPVVEPEPATEEDVDWAGLVATVSTAEEARALHTRAKEAGKLDLDVKQGRRKRKLGELIVEVGKALVEAEQAAAQREEEVVEAEIDEEPDDTPMAMGGE